MKIAAGKFPKVLPFTRKDLFVGTQLAPQQKRMSLSGAQLKCSMTLSRGRLRPSREGEVATHLLKPIPSAPFNAVGDVPANEHLTMQIAEKSFGIATAANALVEFADGEIAYVTRRFDRDAGGRVLHQEDFCQLAERSTSDIQEDFKYQGSYEEIGQMLLRHSSAPIIDIRRFFAIFLFNYFFSNGDAHRKNFSLLEYAPGDLRLSPAYDLLCTRLHVPNESRLALDLFRDDFETDFFSENGYYGIPDFLLFGARLGIGEDETVTILSRFSSRLDESLAMVESSLLSSDSKRIYTDYLIDRFSILKRGI